MKESNRRNDQTIWLPCGENCMPINVLRRHQKNAPSTPFSTGRSDIEHVEYFEKSNYKQLLNENYLIEANAYSEKCILNIAKKSSGIFRPGKHRYMEFTHHNPLLEKDREIIKRRAKRMISMRKLEVKKILFYHHRNIKGFTHTKEILKQKAKNILKNYNHSTKFIFYSQTIVAKDEDRGIEVNSTYNNKIIFCNLRTRVFWGGNDLKIFFGVVDEDLFTRMFNLFDTENL